MNHLDHPEMPGIYQIVHLKSGKRYVGSTVDLRERCRAHGFDLRGNRHFCAHLQNAWNKYGEDAFEFRVIETCLAEKTILFAREQFWMDKNRKRLYNSSLVAEIFSAEYWDSLPERHLVCKFCDKKFSIKTNKKKVEYCSHECVVKGRRKEGIANEERICGVCGKTFVVEKWFKFKYCSPACGNRSGSKVTPAMVLEICTAFVAGAPVYMLVEKYGVSEGVVNHMIRRNTWKHVELPDEIEAKLAVMWTKEAKRRRLLDRNRRKSVVTIEQVKEIKRRLAEGQSVKFIADEMGLTYNNVYPIKTGATYFDISA